MLKFGERWSAVCPKCNFTVTPDGLPLCRNCGKGMMLVDCHTNYGVRSMFFGCQTCSQSYPYGPNCPKCGTSVKGVANPSGTAKSGRLLLMMLTVVVFCGFLLLILILLH
jgi:hypothetical protein